MTTLMKKICMNNTYNRSIGMCPFDKTALHSFLGSIVMFGRFIDNISSKLAILHDLVKKDVPFQWLPSHQKGTSFLTKSCRIASTTVPRRLYNQEAYQKNEGTQLMMKEFEAVDGNIEEYKKRRCRCHKIHLRQHRIG